MNTVILEANIDRPDDLYAAIVDLTAGHNDAEAFARQARLILLLANQIGNVDTVVGLIRLAAQSADDRQGGARNEKAK